MNQQPPRTLFGKAFWILKHRPATFFPATRTYVLFRLSRLFQPLFLDTHSVLLGKNVRIQRLRCVHVEKPNAKIKIGDHSIIYEKADIAAYGNSTIEIDEYSVFGDTKVSARYGIKIGKRFVSSWNVFIQDFDPHPVDPIERAKQIQSICSGFRPRYAKIDFPERYVWEFPGSPIEIGDDVWIGANATILKGAKIGNGCVVATGSVVLGGEYPDFSVIAGNPAKVVKTLERR